MVIYLLFLITLAELYSKTSINLVQTNQQQSLPQLLFSPAAISDTLKMVESVTNSRRSSNNIKLPEVQRNSIENLEVYDQELYGVRLEREGKVERGSLNLQDYRPTQSPNTSINAGSGVKRSSMSGGRRGSGQSKNVSWHNDDF